MPNIEDDDWIDSIPRLQAPPEPAGAVPLQAILVEHGRSNLPLWLMAGAGVLAVSLIAGVAVWKLATLQPSHAAASDASFSFNGVNGSPRWFVSPWFEAKNDWEWSYEVKGRTWFIAIESREDVLMGDANGPSGQSVRLAMRDFPDDATGVPPSSQWSAIRNRASGVLAVGGERRIRIYCEGPWKIDVHSRSAGQ